MDTNSFYKELEELEESVNKYGATFSYEYESENFTYILQPTKEQFAFAQKHESKIKETIRKTENKLRCIERSTNVYDYANFDIDGEHGTIRLRGDFRLIRSAIYMIVVGRTDYNPFHSDD